MADKVYYSFLPWLRRGIINLATNQNIVTGKDFGMKLGLEVKGNTANATVTQDLRIYNPGDIMGIDSRAVVRTIPRKGVKDFEANFLCGIEFFEEDFPWRYTPAAPGTNDQLKPWLWLVVLKDDEYVRQAGSDLSLPAIKIHSTSIGTALPPHGTTWAWAHTHFNGQVPAGSKEAISAWLNTQLQQNPSLGCSRLLCPRHLQPATHYTAFLIPAFERGRMAGMGDEEAAIEAVPLTTASWEGEATNKFFPVYYEWDFTTHSAGDFEELAKRLSPLSGEEEFALNSANKLIDITAPGWGLKHATVSRAIPVSSVLRPVSQTVAVPITGNASSGPVPTDDVQFLENVAKLLNLGATPLVAGSADTSTPNVFYENSALEDDPMIVPPLYGSFYRTADWNKDTATPIKAKANLPVTDWYNQLNLDPTLRYAAAIGTSVVQDGQEEFMDRAWDGLQQSAEVGKVVKRWNYSMEISQKFYTKRVLPLLSTTNPNEETNFAALAFTAPLHQKMLYNEQSFTAQIGRKTTPAAYSRSFTKLIRRKGPLMRRLNPQAASTTVFFENRVTTPSQMNGPLYDSMKKAHDMALAFDEALDKVGVVAAGRLNNNLNRQGYGDITSTTAVLRRLLPYIQMGILQNFPNTAPVNADLHKNLATLLQPATTISQRLASTLPTGMQQQSGYVPQFPEPMFNALAEKSPDHILPGIEQVPNNRVVMLLQNQSFIESFMVGLNHEIAREFLWREFPSPLNGTPFRQFWDVRDNFSTTPIKEDIKPIMQWGSSALGTHRPPNTVSADNVVILIKGDLLRKYPNTEVFMQRAAWTGTQRRKPVASPAAGDIAYPLFTAQLNADTKFFCFAIRAADAPGNATDPGWYFALKERTGDVHFGMDISDSPTNSGPSWEDIKDEVPENASINAGSPGFLQIMAGKQQRSDQVASVLYQQPVISFVHASCMISKKS